MYTNRYDVIQLSALSKVECDWNVNVVVVCLLPTWNVNVDVSLSREAEALNLVENTVLRRTGYMSGSFRNWVPSRGISSCSSNELQTGCKRLLLVYVATADYSH